MEKRPRRPDPKGHVYSDGRDGCGRLPAEAAGPVHEDSNLLVTRPVEPHRGGRAPDASVHLGDRNRPAGLSLDLVEQPSRDPRCEREHGASIAAPASRNGNASAPGAHENGK